jgi:hypothetical protein
MYYRTAARSLEGRGSLAELKAWRDKCQTVARSLAELHSLEDGDLELFARREPGGAGQRLSWSTLLWKVAYDEEERAALRSQGPFQRSFPKELS